MTPIERALLRQGASVLNLGYRSRHADIATLAAEVGAVLAASDPSGPSRFVTHSLGGLLLRAAVAQGVLPADRIGRVVMLGPPNGGSELADRLPAIPLVGRIFTRITGPAGGQLGTGPSGAAAGLPPVPFPVGIIAGTRSWNPLFSYILGGINDGKVRVDRTRVAGMHDFITVPQWHPLLMHDARVIAQTLAFLDTGRFAR